MGMDWPRMLAYIIGCVDQELLLRNECLAAENRILRAQIKGRLRLSQDEKATLAEIAHRLGRKALAEEAVAAKPDASLRNQPRKMRAAKACPGTGRYDANLCELAQRPQVFVERSEIVRRIDRRRH